MTGDSDWSWAWGDVIGNIGHVLSAGTPAEISQIAPIIALPVAVVAVLPPLLTLVYSVWLNARTRKLENERFEWVRLQELAETLYDRDGKYGLWRQQLAVAELSAFARNKRFAALELLMTADTYYRDLSLDNTLPNHVDILRLIPSFNDAIVSLRHRDWPI